MLSDKINKKLSYNHDCMHTLCFCINSHLRIVIKYIWMQPKSAIIIPADPSFTAWVGLKVMMSWKSRHVSYPDGGFIAEDFINGEPGGQIQHVLQHLLIQLQVGKLALPFQSAQINLIWREVLSKPAIRHRKTSKLNQY